MANQHTMFGAVNQRNPAECTAAGCILFATAYDNHRQKPRTLLGVVPLASFSARCGCGGVRPSWLRVARPSEKMPPQNQSPAMRCQVRAATPPPIPATATAALAAALCDLWLRT